MNYEVTPRTPSVSMGLTQKKDRIGILSVCYVLMTYKKSCIYTQDLDLFQVSIELI